jgi:hypothetical protein
MLFDILNAASGKVMRLHSGAARTLIISQIQPNSLSNTMVPRRNVESARNLTIRALQLSHLHKHHFRVHKNAAPLKHHHLALRAPATTTFRVHKNAAPLKQALRATLNSQL